MDLEDTLIDEQKATEGVWVPFGTDGQLLIGRMEGDLWNRTVAKYTKQFGVQLGRRAVRDPELQRKISLHAMAEVVLLGWKNLRVKGEEITYEGDEDRQAKALDLMERFPMVRDECIILGNDIALFRLEQNEEDRKN